eukprot:CAMPEP_0175463900 /NCGR_PEP_ID=MMETSP0095-20121207/69467_1 /TAXON_ID=311494 /ORGANISM="Alexandrium monilatum, Strain CCMP3105" /LENGTH=148 /DNA_ID=CAMNT_0016765105 /DNA_START=547 /DNA_END=991 /DNA_ORIENTATION=-
MPASGRFGCIWPRRAVATRVAAPASPAEGQERHEPANQGETEGCAASPQSRRPLRPLAHGRRPGARPRADTHLPATRKSSDGGRKRHKALRGGNTGEEQGASESRKVKAQIEPPWPAIENPPIAAPGDLSGHILEAVPPGPKPKLTLE